MVEVSNGTGRQRATDDKVMAGQELDAAGCATVLLDLTTEETAVLRDRFPTFDFGISHALVGESLDEASGMAAGLAAKMEKPVVFRFRETLYIAEASGEFTVSALAVPSVDAVVPDDSTEWGRALQKALSFPPEDEWGYREMLGPKEK